MRLHPPESVVHGRIKVHSISPLLLSSLPPLPSPSPPPLLLLSSSSPHLFLGGYCSSEQQVEQTLRQRLLSTLRLWQQLQRRNTSCNNSGHSSPTYLFLKLPMSNHLYYREWRTHCKSDPTCSAQPTEHQLHSK